MTRGVGGESPANVQAHLKGIDDPANKRDLVATARKNQASRDVLRILQEVPGQNNISHTIF